METIIHILKWLREQMTVLYDLRNMCCVVTAVLWCLWELHRKWRTKYTKSNSTLHLSLLWRVVELSSGSCFPKVIRFTISFWVNRPFTRHVKLTQTQGMSVYCSLLLLSVNCKSWMTVGWTREREREWPRDFSRGSAQLFDLGDQNSPSIDDKCPSSILWRGPSCTVSKCN